MSETIKRLLQENAVRIALLVAFLIGQYYVIRHTIQENTLRIESNVEELRMLQLRVSALDLDLNMKVSRMLAIQERNTEDIQRILEELRQQTQRNADFYEKYGGVLNRLEE